LGEIRTSSSSFPLPHLTAHGLGEFVDTVVPLLRECGVFRAEYGGATLRDNLGLS
jgi:hypothetical protein